MANEHTPKNRIMNMLLEDSVEAADHCEENKRLCKHRHEILQSQINNK